MIVSDIIEEGLLKVPPSLLENVMRIIAHDMLWMLRDKTPKAKYPAHYAAVLQEAKKRGIKLPREKFKVPEKGARFISQPIGDDIPQSYAHIKPNRNVIKVVLDYGTFEKVGDTIAYHWNWRRKDENKQPVGEEESVLIIHMRRIRGVKEFPERRTPEEVPYIIDALKNIVRHELQHAIQYAFLRDTDKSQIGKLPNYSSHQDDYMASQVEFDPQVTDAVHDFLEMWGILNQPGVIRKPTLMKGIKQYIGLLPPATMNGYAMAPIFKALKKNDPQKYRKAVAKFFTELTAELKNQKQLSETKKEGMDDTRLARARAMGFDTTTVYYHGTPSDKNFERLQRGEWERVPNEPVYLDDKMTRNPNAMRWVPAPLEKQQIWFTPNPKYAFHYAQRGVKGGGTIYPVFLRKDMKQAFCAPCYKTF